MKIPVLTVATGLALLSLAQVACDESKASYESILADCARLSACSATEPRSFGVLCDTIYRVEHNQGQDRGTEMALSAALVNCLRKAKSCRQAEACLKADDETAVVCAGADGDDRCAGDVLVECGDYPQERPDAFDCAAAGLICSELDGDGACGDSICDTDQDEEHCEGDLLFECGGEGAWTVVDCRASGGTCGTGLGGGVNCMGAGEACDGLDFQDRCEGTVAVSCLRGFEARFDCAGYGPGYICGTSGPLGFVTCVPAIRDCDDGEAESCTGGVVRFCSMGQWREVDCQKLGYSGCSSQFSAGGTVAFCTP